MILEAYTQFDALTFFISYVISVLLFFNSFFYFSYLVVTSTYKLQVTSTNKFTKV